MNPSKILLIEDEPNIRLMISEMLSAEGHAISAVGDCAQAQELLFESNFDIVMTDVNLPDGSGLDLCQKVKAETPHVRVLLMTGFNIPGLPIEGVRLGADYYMNKPFEMSELLCAVRILGEAADSRSHVQVTSMRPGWYEFVVTSSEDSVIRLQSFLDAMLKDQVGSERFWDVRLAIMELALNAVEWGNQFDSSQNVLISVGIIESGVIVKIQDQGEGFDVRTMMDMTSKMEPSDLQTLRESEGKRPGGLGISLINQMADKLYFNEKANLAILYFARE